MSQPPANTTNQAGTSSLELDDEISDVVAASGVYDVTKERRNIVAVEDLMSLGQNATMAAFLAAAVDLLDAPPRTPPPTIRVTAAPSPETQRRITKEASRLWELGRAGERSTTPRLPNVTTAISDNLYDMYTTGRGWSERLIWEIGGDLMATKPIFIDGREDNDASTSGDEKGDSIIEPQAVIARRVYGRERAEYLSRIAVSMLALQQEKMTVERYSFQLGLSSDM